MNLTAADLARMVPGPERDAALDAYRRGDMPEVARILSSVLRAPAQFQGYGPPQAPPAPIPVAPPPPVRRVRPWFAYAAGVTAAAAIIFAVPLDVAFLRPQPAPPPCLLGAGSQVCPQFSSTSGAPTATTTPATSTSASCPPRPMGLRGAWCDDASTTAPTTRPSGTVPAQVLTPETVPAQVLCSGRCR